MKLILSTNPAKVGLFEKPPVATKANALVYESRKGELLVIKDGDQLSKSELRHFHTVHTINMGTEDFDFEKEYPSMDEIEPIKIRLNVTFQVANPQRIVETQLNDPRKKIEKDLDLFVNKITRNYSIDSLYGLEEDLNSLVDEESFEDKMLSRGIKVTEINALVSLSEEEIEGRKAYKNIDKKTAITKKEKEHDEIITEIDRGNQLKELEHVTSVYRDYGYFGAKTVFRNDPQLTSILEEIHQQMEEQKRQERIRQQQQEDKLTQLVIEMRQAGATAAEIDETIAQIKGIGSSDSEEQPQKKIEESTTNKERWKEKLKTLEATEGE